MEDGHYEGDLELRTVEKIPNALFPVDGLLHRGAVPLRTNNRSKSKHLQLFKPDMGIAEEACLYVECSILTKYLVEGPGI